MRNRPEPIPRGAAPGGQLYPARRGHLIPGALARLVAHQSAPQGAAQGATSRPAGPLEFLTPRATPKIRVLWITCPQRQGLNKRLKRRVSTSGASYPHPVEINRATARKTLFFKGLRGMASMPSPGDNRVIAPEAGTHTTSHGNRCNKGEEPIQQGRRPANGTHTTSPMVTGTRAAAARGVTITCPPGPLAEGR